MSDAVNVYDLGDIAMILGTANCAPVSCSDGHRIIGNHLDLDVSEILAVAQHIPLCLRGDAHLAARRRIAEIISASSTQTRAVVEREITAMIADLLTPGHHDVMQEFVTPLVNKLIGETVGVPLHLSEDTLVSRLFSHTIGISKRKRMNTELRELRQAISAELPHLNDIEVGDRLALCILGSDAMRGTLARSLHTIFESGSSAPDDPALTETYSKTGVPFIDREALESVEIEGQERKAGTILRSRLEAFEHSDDPKVRNRFFGFGIHTCLGRTLALQVWRQIQKGLDEKNVAVSVTAFALRKDDTFHIPETFELEVHLA